MSKSEVQEGRRLSRLWPVLPAVPFAVADGLGVAGTGIPGELVPRQFASSSRIWTQLLQAAAAVCSTSASLLINGSSLF